jgi:hypothetical protein
MWIRIRIHNTGPNRCFSARYCEFQEKERDSYFLSFSTKCFHSVFFHTTLINSVTYVVIRTRKIFGGLGYESFLSKKGSCLSDEHFWRRIIANIHTQHLVMNFSKSRKPSRYMENRCILKGLCHEINRLIFF